MGADAQYPQRYAWTVAGDSCVDHRPQYVILLRFVLKEDKAQP